MDKTIPELLDKIASEMCDKYCKFPDQAKDEDELFKNHAHYKKIGWIPVDSLKALGDEIVAWMPLPKQYNAEMESGE